MKELEEMDVLMAYATLKAPFAGVVTQRAVDPGDLVRNIQTASDAARPLFTIAQLRRVRVRVAVPEHEVPDVHVDAKVTIVLRALPNHSFDAKISRTPRALDESTRTMLVEIDLDLRHRLGRNRSRIEADPADRVEQRHRRDRRTRSRRWLEWGSRRA